MVAKIDMIKNIVKSARYFAGPFFKYLITSKPDPMLADYKITHRCNLQCMHCPYWKRYGAELDFDGVKKTLISLKKLGVKILILEGGEPTLWRDGKKSISHVIEEARNLFPSVCMTTNGTLPFKCLALDQVWVSLDGTQEIHDRIRGEGVFKKVWENLESEAQGKSYISLTINRLNVQCAWELIEKLKSRVAGVTLQFYYPYTGLPDPLFIGPSDRVRIIDELIQLKLEGYPVANTFGSLNQLKKIRWTCHDGLLANAEPDGTISPGCYLRNRGSWVCERCGFTAHNEISLAFEGNIESIKTGLKIFFRGLKEKET